VRRRSWRDLLPVRGEALLRAASAGRQQHRTSV